MKNSSKDNQNKPQSPMQKSTPNPQSDLNQIDEEPQQKRKKHRNKKHKHSNSSSSSEQSHSSQQSPSNQKNSNMKIIKDLIAEHFVLLTVIGKGAFGQILLSFNMRENVEVAVKKEMRKPNKPPQLRTEAKVYSTLLNVTMPDLSGVQSLKQDNVQGVPTFYGMGEFQDFYYLIMEFLGPNLIELLNYCKTRKFTISTVCLIALQILNRIENIHKHHYLHRDIKPENFLIGTQEKSNIIYLIDFGLSKRYKNPKNHQHIPYREGRLLTGTARYVSINTHLGIEQSRRDDLESIGYVLIFFLKGSLPWQGLKVGNDKYVRIMEKKLQIPTEILCYGLPDEMSYYLNYCKSLRFEDRPDYDYLRQLFIKLLGSCNTIYGLTKEYLKFDWCFDDPVNSIWQVFSKGKKGKQNEDMILSNNKETSTALLSNNTKQKRVSNDVTDNGKGGILKVNNCNVNEKLGNKQLSNIDEAENNCEEKENMTKTNENNPIVSDNSSSGIDDSKSKGSNDNDSCKSEDTLKEEFRGIFKPELIDLINGEVVEDIDKYINQLLQGSTFLKTISKNDKAKNQIIIGNKKGKLKDSLDLGNNEHEHLHYNNNTKHNTQPIDKQEEDDDEDESPKQKELMKNTMRNSKILSREDLAKIAANNAKLIKSKQQDQKTEKRISKIQFKNESNNSKSSSISSKSSSSIDSSKSSKKNDESKTLNQFNKNEEPSVLMANSSNAKSSKKTFESHLMPKLNNDGKERRKSKILEMNMLP